MASALLSSAPEETYALGERLGGSLRGDEVVLVSGELGAGKTVFIKGLAAALGIPPAEVVSPTYVLMNLYSGKFDLYHFDLYRLGTMPEALENPVDECLGAGVLAVEWAQYLDAGYFALANAVAVTIEAEAGGRRRITIRSPLPYIATA
ncbi:MAG: tRNA (adenosine(37)-N6)-threonylcarbamoyltransferase complex ATPase subunit type 1 TsaE [Acidobacteria bacterium]|jgi:tRNA threonylcarbamoyladenosine biosynthesis protein TsaE|nr:tRNA (adenosine(37)-N6)-threonylcarbamoyltransferase complex ATPase subunit type 1 TsaE [Acidobacteriota bacterium]